VYWGMSATGDDFFEWKGAHLPNANKVLIAHVAMNAFDRARKICAIKKCGCSSVEVHFVQLNSRGEIVSPKKPDRGVPVVNDIKVPCCQEGSSK
jgi:hypothetical protein